ncbi:unnamed protein product [Arctogadus glacialis]
MMGRACAQHPPTIPPETDKVRPALLSQGAADGERTVKERLEAQPAVWGTLVHEGGGEEEEEAEEEEDQDEEEEEQDEEEEEEENNKEEEEEEEDDEDEEEEEEDEEEERVGSCFCQNHVRNPDFPATHLASIYGELISGEC